MWPIDRTSHLGRSFEPNSHERGGQFEYSSRKMLVTRGGRSVLLPGIMRLLAMLDETELDCCR